MTYQNNNDIQKLFEAAEEDGALSPEALLALSTMDIGAQIRGGLGLGVDDVQSSEVILCTIMPDDSGSIRFAGNTNVVLDGHNAVIEALASSKQKDSILAHTRYLNGFVLYLYRQVELAEKMTKKNYDPSLGTPLYDQTLVLLGTVIAKTQEMVSSGVSARSVTLIITDGADSGSHKATAKNVALIVQDMLKTEQHIVAAMGIDDGNTAFRDIFREMGIEDRWILTPRSNAAEIRKAFHTFSQSAIRASQHASAFTQAAAGGFLG